MNPEALIREYLTNLGLEADIVTLYVALSVRSPQTISELARSSGVERTRIYRLLDELKASSLIEIDEEYARGLLSAAPITNLEIVLSGKEQQLNDMRERLPAVVEALQQTATASHDATVQFYRGAQGCRQLLWNETHATTEVLSVLADTVQARTDARFFERWADQLNQQDITLRSIVDDHFQASLAEWYGPDVQTRLKNWQSRYVSPDVFAITTNTVIYDDVVAYYSWNGRETFGVELHSQPIADSQRQFFELLWSQATTETSA